MSHLMPSTPLRKQIFRLAALAILVLGLTAMPNRLSAQQAALAQTSAALAEPHAAQAEGAAQAEEKAAESEEEEKNLYRHTKLVEAVGKILNLSTEQTARLFEIINFLIIALCVLIPLVRFLPKVFRKRSELLRDKIETARKSTDEANQRLSAVEAKLTQLDGQIAGFRAEVEREMASDESRIKASIEEEKTRIVASAELEIASAAAHAERTLRNFAANLAIEQAASQIKLTDEADRALIAEFLDSANQKGGQN